MYLMQLKFPERVKSLSFIAPLLYPVEITPFYNCVHFFAWLIPLCGTRLMKSMLRYFVSKYDNGDNVSIWTEMDLDEYIAPFIKSGGWSALVCLLNNYDKQAMDLLTHEYSRIKCATMVVYGDLDATTPCFGAFQFKGSGPQAEVHILKRKGHLCLEEAPITLRNLLGQFLKTRS